MERDSILSAKLITSEDWILYVTSAMAHCEDRILQLWIGNTTLITSPALCARQSLARKTAITNMMGKSSVTFITQPNLRNDVMDVRLRFSSNSWRSSGMGKTSTGILSVI